jgi:hypothetical protein
LFHRVVRDGEEMGFLPLRDNRASWHGIYAHIEAAFVTEVIDRRRQPAAAAPRWRRGASPHDPDGPDCQQDGQVTAPGHPERGPPQGSP